jgi:hypothetical protein
LQLIIGQVGFKLLIVYFNICHKLFFVTSRVSLPGSRCVAPFYSSAAISQIITKPFLGFLI